MIGNFSLSSFAFEKMWPKIGILYAIFVSIANAAPSVPFAEQNSFRLPQSSFPLRYDIALSTSVHNGL